MSYNILLVDDDSEFRNEFKDYFYDYNVIEVSKGNEAIELLNKPNNVDIVILDVVLPDVKGTKVLKEIKKMDSDLSIVILTGYGSKEIAVEALKGDADDYIEKPLKIKKAHKIIKNLLQEKGIKGRKEPLDSKGKVEKVKRYLQKNYDKKVLLKDAASIVYLSPKYLSRVFKQHTRVNKAKELLHIL